MEMFSEVLWCLTFKNDRMRTCTSLAMVAGEADAAFLEPSHRLGLHPQPLTTLLNILKKRDIS